MKVRSSTVFLTENVKEGCKRQEKGLILPSQFGRRMQREKTFFLINKTFFYEFEMKYIFVCCLSFRLRKLQYG